MNIVACYKIVPDEQDIVVNQDGSLDFSRAKPIIGEYDLMAIEEAVRIAEATDGCAMLLSVGGPELTETKLVKSALSRGAAELYAVVNSDSTYLDAFQTASLLVSALKKIDFDLVLCGEGSSDLYAQQVGPLVGALANLPVINSVSNITIKDSKAIVERTLEGEVEILEIALPAIISVTTDINLPRIPQLKDILAAGKKPVTVWSLDDVGGLVFSPVETVSVKAPKNIERKKIIYEDASIENINALASNIRASW